MKLPRIMLTAAASGSGKTLITCGILQSLKNKDYAVASFKCGPDYIDPMFHSRVIGTHSRNLDSFFTDPAVLRHLMMKNGNGMDIAVVEGVMGFYDGLAGISSKASAWEVAAITETPVVFIVNCKGMSTSVIPYIKGFLEYKENSHIKGVLLNQISPMLYERLKKQIEQELPVKVCGYLPVVEECVLQSRHLGLVMPSEIPELQENLQRLAKVMEESIEWEVLAQIAAAAPDLDSNYQPPARIVAPEEPVRIAVARDEAFCFFYEDNLQLLKELGAELVEFSPIHDEKMPPDVHGLILNGGYPELYGQELSANESIRQEIKAAILSGLPCTAECGGFMYLHDDMEDVDGEHYPMVGIITGKAYKTPRLNRFGYVTLSEGSAFGEHIESMHAHEFHYYDSTNCGEDMWADKPLSTRHWRCMHSTDTLLAGFPHLYYYGNSRVAEIFVRKCAERKGRR